MKRVGSAQESQGVGSGKGVGSGSGDVQMRKLALEKSIVDNSYWNGVGKETAESNNT